MKGLSVAMLVFIALHATCLVAGGAGFERFESIVRDEMIYPRELSYAMPVTLPAMNSNDAKNREYNLIADALKEKGIIDIAYEGGIKRIVPRYETFNIIRQNVNIKYEIQSLNLILGQWDIEVTGMETPDGRVVLTGRRFASRTTSIYETVLNILPQRDRRSFTSLPMRWVIEDVNGRRAVSEETLGPP